MRKLTVKDIVMKFPWSTLKHFEMQLELFAYLRRVCFGPNGQKSRFYHSKSWWVIFSAAVMGHFRGLWWVWCLSGHLQGEAGEPTPLSGCVWLGLCSGRGRGIGTGRATGGGGGGSKKEPGSLFWPLPLGCRYTHTHIQMVRGWKRHTHAYTHSHTHRDTCGGVQSQRVRLECYKRTKTFKNE